MTSASPMFAPWIEHFPGPTGPRRGAIVVFPHAGGAASGYRKLGMAFSSVSDTYIVQYPQRAERLRDPAPETVDELAQGLFRAGAWRQVAPLRLFGHSLGAVVAFEFTRIAEAHRIAVQKLWVSAGPVPSQIAALPDLPTINKDLLADLAEIGATDSRLLADEESSNW
jgi:surfactin synthase thioesterase subunit